MLKLGKEGRDTITGFKGIITARHTYITGCDQYSISGKMKENGELGELYSFDEGRIKIIGNGILPDSVQTKTKGGPQFSAKASK